MNINHMMAITQLSTIPKRGPLFLTKHVSVPERSPKTAEDFTRKMHNLIFSLQPHLLKSVLLCMGAHTFLLYYTHFKNSQHHSAVKL